LNLVGLLVSFAVSFAFLVVAMTIHEFAHGWTANLLGDPTAKHSGRLTLNPLAHIDPFWTLLLPLLLFISSSGQFVFGAAKPVPINYWALKNPKRDVVLIGASGPLANLLMALGIALLMRSVAMHPLASTILFNLLLINVVLGVFNLIPIPPLDGSRILMGLLPDRLADSYSRIEPFSFVILLFFVWMGLFSRLIWPVVDAIVKLLLGGGG
jgi:Zn-dependent protease